jgi:hypothetical protein
MRFISLLVVAMPLTAALAQNPTAQAGAPFMTAVSMTEAQQIAAAVLPLPAEARDQAKVMGYKGGSPKLVTLREGKTFTCFLPEASGKSYHAACYHQSLEAFMARGRDLRASGTKDEKVDTVRFAEVKSGKLVMPKQPATMYQLFGGAFDPATNAAPGSKALIVVYITGATGASTGLPEKPVENGMWIMYPGTPKAHIMLTPKM